MAVIRCPNCGKPNPDFIEVCQYCDTKLPRAGAAPGTPPPPAADETLIRPPAPPAAGGTQSLGWMDRLIKMQSGETPPAAKAQADEPDWMWAGAARDDLKTPSPAPTPPAAADTSADLPEWLRDLDQSLDAAPQKPAPAPPAAITNSQNLPPTPARGLPIAAPQAPQPPEPSPFEPTASDVTIPPRPRRKLTDWLDKLHDLPQQAAPAEPESPVIPNTDADLPDWLKAVSAEAEASGNAAPGIEAATQSYRGPAAAPTPEDDLPDWLRTLRSQSAPPSPAPSPSPVQSPPPASAGPAAPSRPAASGLGAGSFAAGNLGTGGLTTRRNQELPQNVRPPSADDTLIPRPGAKPLETSDDMPDWLRGILSAEAQSAARSVPPAPPVPPAPAAPVMPATPAADRAADHDHPVSITGPAADAVRKTGGIRPAAASAAAAAMPETTPPAAPPTPPAPPAMTPRAGAPAPTSPTVPASRTPDIAANQPPDAQPQFDYTLPPPSRPSKRLTDWLGNVPAPAGDAKPAEVLPDWLKTLSAETTTGALPQPPAPESTPPAPATLPAGLPASAPTPPPAAPASATPAALPAAELPDWLKAMAPAPAEGGQLAPAAAAPAEELPDWLQSVAPAAAPSTDIPTDRPPLATIPATLAAAGAPAQPPAPDVTAAAPADELPDWLQTITQGQTAEPPAATPLVPAVAAQPVAVVPEPPAPEPATLAAATPTAQPAPADELPDWLKAMTQGQTPEPPAAIPLAPPAATPLAPAVADQPAAAMPEAPAPANDLPDWLKAITQASEAAATLATTAAEAADAAPARLAFEADSTLVPSAAPAQAGALLLPAADQPPAAPAGPPSGAAETLPPWLQGVGASPLPGQEVPELDEETLAWLSESQKPAAAPEPAGLDLASAQLPAEKPAWLDELAAVTPATSPATPAEIAPTPVDEMPEWLRTLRGQATEDVAPEAMPDWLRALRGLPPGAPPATTTAPAAGTAAPSRTAATPSAAAPARAPAPSGLEQVALPAWLAAMRPVDIEQPVASAADSYEETLGVLAGMRGVLRAEPVVAQPHKATTPVHALAVSAEHTAHASLLNELLHTEITAQPARGQRVRVSALVERWIVSLVLLAALVLTQFQAQLGLPALFAPPAPNLPPESAALYSLIERLPKDKPALVAFDYDAAQAGELSPGAQAVIGHLAKRGVSVVGVSLRLTGPAVAEQVLSQTATAGYVNLGFIAGGPVGLLQFATDARSVFSTDFSGHEQVWHLASVAGVSRLSDFGLIVLVSGGPEATRAWIEQTQSLAAEVPLVAVVSAGAEAMVRPYYDDPNANSVLQGHLPLKGLIVGLGGAAAYERATYAPGAATSLWPALGGGLLAAALLILFGNLFAAGWGALRRPRIGGSA